MKRIDAHHHLWHYTEGEFGWLEGDLLPLRRDFLAEDLLQVSAAAGVDGTVAVQARQTIEETRFLLGSAKNTGLIQGVVGWLPLASSEFPGILASFANEPLLKGLRHVVQGEPAGFLDAQPFNNGIQALRGTGLVYDILIFEHQLEEAIRFVDRHPHQAFVLDHIAKPRIRHGVMQPWAQQIHEIARRPNVTCKVSGMVTEADPGKWSADALKPYFDIVLAAFGPDRLMVGTDWPVLTAGCEYALWWKIVEEWIAPLSKTEQAAILGGNAQRIYKLSESAQGEGA